MILEISKINKNLSELKGWIFKNNMITKEYTFDKYMDGIQFINDLAIIAETSNHHPDINLGNKEYEEKLKLITLAYTQLKNTYREKIDT